VIHLKKCRSVWWLALLGVALSLCHSTAGEDRAVSEYQVKSAFIYNFTKFVDWPDNAFATTNAPLVIGIVGEDFFGKNLDAVVANESLRGHPLVVKRFQSGDEVTGCHILFISRSEKEKLDDTLNQLNGRHVLTVGDTTGFTARGVMVNLLVVQGSVKMEINLKAAEQAGLQISSKLLGLAKIVEPGAKASRP
jgi:hypothetical protein